jgi:hypothetical protein
MNGALRKTPRGGDARRSDEVRRLVDAAAPVDGIRAVSSVVKAADVKTLQALGDACASTLALWSPRSGPRSMTRSPRCWLW